MADEQDLDTCSAGQHAPPQPAIPELLPPGVTVGRHSYGFGPATFRIFMHGARIEVGSFCSFGPEVRLLAGSEHITSRVSTFPFNALIFAPEAGNEREAIDRGVTRVGHDVWLGLGSMVLSGVQVGHGAVIGAGTVVSRAVPPYSVVVGNPARLIRYRFPEATRRQLLELRWWDWPDETIRELNPLFMGDTETFLRRASEVERPSPTQDPLLDVLARLDPALVTPARTRRRPRKLRIRSFRSGF